MLYTNTTTKKESKIEEIHRSFTTRFEVLDESEAEQEQVFHKRPDSMTKDRATILEKMTDMETRLDTQEKQNICNSFRQPKLETRIPVQTNYSRTTRIVVGVCFFFT